jgi:hypothetical protein
MTFEINVEEFGLADGDACPHTKVDANRTSNETARERRMTRILQTVCSRIKQNRL